MCYIYCCWALADNLNRSGTHMWEQGVVLLLGCSLLPNWGEGELKRQCYQIFYVIYFPTKIIH